MKLPEKDIFILAEGRKGSGIGLNLEYIRG